MNEHFPTASSGGTPSPYASVVSGRVVRGEGLGRKLGFPTANIKIAASARAPRGVWKVLVSGTTLGHRLGACNVGVRPTVGDRAIRRGSAASTRRWKAAGRRLVVEVHVPGFHGNLYGRTLSLGFLAKIRCERRFPTLAALKAQIRRDVSSLTL